MKCYRATNERIDAGLILQEGRYILAASSNCRIKASLTDQLVEKVAAQSVSREFTLGNPQVQRCDVDPRSELWILPETDATIDLLLVQFTWNLGRCRSLDVQVNGPGSAIIFDRSSKILGGDIKEYAGACFFARLAPGGSLTVQAVQDKFMGVTVLRAKSKYRTEKSTVKISYNLGSAMPVFFGSTVVGTHRL